MYLSLGSPDDDRFLKSAPMSKSSKKDGGRYEGRMNFISVSTVNSPGTIFFAVTKPVYIFGFSRLFISTKIKLSTFILWNCIKIKNWCHRFIFRRQYTNNNNFLPNSTGITTILMDRMSTSAIEEDNKTWIYIQQQNKSNCNGICVSRHYVISKT